MVATAGNRRAGPSAPDQYVRVGGVRARYRTAGAGDPAIVLIHGFGASLESWEGNIHALGRGHRTVAVDLPWFGKSDKPACEVTRYYFADFIAGFMDAIGLSSAVLVGNSMGGMVAVLTARRYPDRVAALVLVNPAGFGRELAWWFRVRAVLPTLNIVRPSMRTYRFAVRRLVFDPGVVTDDLVSAFVEMAREPGALDAHHRVLKYGTDWRGLKSAVVDEVLEAARAINVPTLVVWGKQDRVVPVAHAEIALQSINGAQLHIFDRCGHAPMVEKPDEFNQLVSEFVANRLP